MINQDFILLIFNCKKYKFKADLQRKTWLKNIPKNLLYFHVIGDPNLSQEFIFDNKDNILIVKTKDDYISLPQKVISAYEAIYKTYNFKYIFKTDDDQNLIYPKFLFVLIKYLIKNNYDYGGKKIIVRKTQYSNYHEYHDEIPNNCIVKKGIYCSGRFYFLSYNSIQNLIPKKNIFKNEYFEDHAIGYNLDEKLKNIFFNLPTEVVFNDFEFT